MNTINTSVVAKIKSSFISNFNSTPLLIRAPGRINLIGEHTDYNEGFVLPAAVSHSIYFAIGESGHASRCSLISLDFDERYAFDLTDMAPLPAGSWQNYVMGVAAELIKTGHELLGFNLVFTGDIPRGSGMSSSAALECGTCFGLNELFELGIPKIEMVKMSQMAEHNYAGVQCGIMDQFASLNGKSAQALLLDCRSLEYSYFPIGLTNYKLMLFNSNVTHSLASSEYNVRRGQCDLGVSILRSFFPEVDSLRDATMELLMSIKSNMDDLIFKRCKYVIEENNRVEDFAKALAENDLQQAGLILCAAHHAMRYEYEITCPEIDFIADYLNGHDEVLGARMMGGGFGGCVLAIIKRDTQASLAQSLNQSYEIEFGRSVTAIEVEIGDGVSKIGLL